MSLAYKNDTYNYNGEYEMGSLNKFAQAERRLSAKKQALDDMKNEYDLIEQQAFRTYKENIQYMLLDQPSTIKTCREWLNMLSKNQDADGNKLDKRKKYKEKEMYDLKHELIAAQIKAESSAKEIKELKSEISKYQKNIVKLETELNDSKK